MAEVEAEVEAVVEEAPGGQQAYHSLAHGDASRCLYGTALKASAVGLGGLDSAAAKGLSQWTAKSRHSVSTTVFKYWFEMVMIVLAPVVLVLPTLFVPIGTGCDAKSVGFVTNIGVFGLFLGAYIVLMFELVCKFTLCSKILVLVLTPTLLIACAQFIFNNLSPFDILGRNFAMAGAVAPIFLVPVYHIWQEVTPHESHPVTSSSPLLGVSLHDAALGPSHDAAKESSHEAHHMSLKSTVLSIKAAHRLHRKVLMRHLKRFSLATGSMVCLGLALVFCTVFTQYFIRHGDRALGTALLLTIFYAGHGLLAAGGCSLAEACDREKPAASTHQDRY
jgi:hypothetical protein